MRIRASLLSKYLVALVAVVGIPLLVYSLVDAWFTYREHRAALATIQRGHAADAALRIARFIRELEGQLGWATHLSWLDDPSGQRRRDAQRLLMQAPAITDLLLLDGDGRERLFVSRLSLDRIDAGTDHSAEPWFIEPMAHRVHYGPVYFRRETEPFMTLALAGGRREFGVAAAEVNLKHIWEVVAQMRVGRRGSVYVVDGSGRLVAHPDISLVLRNTDLSDRLRLDGDARRDARGGLIRSRSTAPGGGEVLTASARVDPLDWTVFVELPVDEADEALDEALRRAFLITAAGLLLAIVIAYALARRMVGPIRMLTAGAARIGSGRLDYRISIRSGDELETLGGQFNEMATRLEASYADLERKVAERTGDLAAANQSKSRFLAAASHDLRQPLHALGLLIAQLGTESEPGEQRRLVGRIQYALAGMNRLFGGLLDISKLDAGVVAPSITTFPIQRVLARVDAAFSADAAAKGLSLRIVDSRAWVCSDEGLLERVVFNLVGNAVRYTDRGGVVLGVRRDGPGVRIEVWDSGIGIPIEEQGRVFSEFFHVDASGSGRGDGLGLGLAIVDRLCRLLGHPVGLRSQPGAGSRFTVGVPRAEPRASAPEPAPRPGSCVEPLRGRRILVVDNDALVLESTGGLLRSWGCEVVTAASAQAALEALGDDPPELVVADFRLDDGLDGAAAIHAVRCRFHIEIPAFLVSGDISPEVRTRAESRGLHLLDKPIEPVTLRAMTSRMLLAATAGAAGPSATR